MKNNYPIIIIGGGGHATVLIELLKLLGKTILGVVAPQFCTIKNYSDINYLGNDEVIFKSYYPRNVKLINGVGAVSVQKNQVRQKIFQIFKDAGYSFETLVHPSAIVANTVILDEGVQVMARVVIQPNTIIEKNTIINTGACIDHDCFIAENTHIAPGVTISGNVTIGKNSHIGVGTNIIQGIDVGCNVMISAGSTVVKNVSIFQKSKE